MMVIPKIFPLLNGLALAQEKQPFQKLFLAQQQPTNYSSENRKSNFLHL